MRKLSTYPAPGPPVAHVAGGLPHVLPAVRRVRSQPGTAATRAAAATSARHSAATACVPEHRPGLLAGEDAVDERIGARVGAREQEEELANPVVHLVVRIRIQPKPRYERTHYVIITMTIGNWLCNSFDVHEYSFHIVIPGEEIQCLVLFKYGTIL